MTTMSRGTISLSDPPQPAAVSPVLDLLVLALERLVVLLELPPVILEFRDVVPEREKQ
jgi:hypothetical protein